MLNASVFVRKQTWTSQFPRLKKSSIILPLADDRIHYWRNSAIFKMDEISEYLGREMTAELFEVNSSTHYGRMVRTDDNTVVLYGDMNEMLEFI